MERRPGLILGSVTGALTAVPLIAILFLGERFAALPFVPFDTFDWLARVLPGDVIRLGIDLIVRAIGVLGLGSTSDAAKTIEQLQALALVVGAGALMGLLVAAVMRVSRLSGGVIGAIAGLILMLPALNATALVGFNTPLPLAVAWLAVLFGAWGAFVGNFLDQSPPAAVAAAGPPADPSRRAALVRLAGGSAAVTVGAWGLGQYLGGSSSAQGAGQALTSLVTATPEAAATTAPAATATTAEVAATAVPGATAAATATPLPTATAVATTRDRVAPAPGTRDELTENQDFYRIDINTRPVAINQSDWELEVGGLVENPQRLTLDDFLAMPAVTQPVTMSCISNRIGGDLIGTSNWSGVRMRDMMKAWGVKPEATALYIEAADGFYETVVMEDLMDPRTLLVYGMNGETLPVEHGFPLRIYIADRYGMKQPKWITRLEFMDRWTAGYWVVRGWSREARPQIVSVIDTILREPDANGLHPVGGIAWAGDRVIQKVELSIDGEEWVETTLRTPPLSPLTWVQWRYDWAATPGNHTLRVRATDSTGALQIEQPAKTYPDGATGYHVRSVTI